MQTQLSVDHNQPRDDAWHAILHASEMLLNAAQSEKWEELSDLASERDILIRAYFSNSITVENAIQVRDKIQQLLAIDDQVLGLARKEQENLQPALKAFSKNKKAINAYQQAGL